MTHTGTPAATGSAVAAAMGRLDLSGRAYVVTGGGSGIGRATAELIAGRGGAVLVADLSGGSAEDVASAIRRDGGAAVACHVDVCVEQDAAAMVAAAVRHFGRLDGAFNNAGIGGRGVRLAALDAADWARTLATDLTGVFHCLKHETGYLAEHGGGSVVNTSSGAAVLISGPAQGDYAAAKAGVLGLTRAAARDYAKRGVRVNAVVPGLIETGMSRPITDDAGQAAALVAGHPLGRWGQPAEVAEAVCWLLSEAASFVTGIALPVDGGYSAAK